MKLDKLQRETQEHTEWGKKIQVFPKTTFLTASKTPTALYLKPQSVTMFMQTSSIYTTNEHNFKMSKASLSPLSKHPMSRKHLPFTVDRV